MTPWVCLPRNGTLEEHVRVVPPHLGSGSGIMASFHHRLASPVKYNKDVLHFFFLNLPKNIFCRMLYLVY